MQFCSSAIAKSYPHTLNISPGLSEVCTLQKHCNTPIPMRSDVFQASAGPHLSLPSPNGWYRRSVSRPGSHPEIPQHRHEEKGVSLGGKGAHGSACTPSAPFPSSPAPFGHRHSSRQCGLRSNRWDRIKLRLGPRQ